MKIAFLAGAALAAMLGSSACFAQVAPPPGVAQGTAPPVRLMPPPPPPAIERRQMMLMSDRPIMRDELLRHVRAMFARLDANHDGFITRDEVDAVRARIRSAVQRGAMGRRFARQGAAAPNRPAMFDRLDTNHDGVISREEFMAGHAQMRERRMIIIRNARISGAPAQEMTRPGMMGMNRPGKGMGFAGHLFDMADLNHDGRVSLAEAEQAVIRHFDRADLNHDGVLSPDEQRQMHQRMHDMRRPG